MLEMYSCTPPRETTRGNYENEIEMNSSTLASLHLTSNTAAPTVALPPPLLSIQIKVSTQKLVPSIISTKSIINCVLLLE